MGMISSGVHEDDCVYAVVALDSERTEMRISKSLRCTVCPSRPSAIGRPRGQDVGLLLLRLHFVRRRVLLLVRLLLLLLSIARLRISLWCIPWLRISVLLLRRVDSVLPWLRCERAGKRVLLLSGPEQSGRRLRGRNHECAATALRKVELRNVCIRAEVALQV